MIELMFGSGDVGLRAGESVVNSNEGSWEAPSWVPQIAEGWEGDKTRSVRLPEDVESLDPGPELAEVVWGVDRSRLSGYDLVTLLQAEARLVAHFQAAYYSTITEISGLLTDADTASAEVAAALNLTRASSEAEYGLAGLLTRFPAVLEALEKGVIDLRRARVITDGIASLKADTATTVIEKVLPVAGGLTTGQLRARVNRLRMEHDAESAEKAYRTGLEQRKLTSDANSDGTANLLGWNLNPTDVAAARRHINRLARKARTPGDIRTWDQIRADTYCDLLTGRTTSAGNHGTPTVDIVVPLTTLIELSETPGDIPGYGPVIAELARQIVANQVDCRWEYIITDQGQPVATGTIRRRPTQAMKRRIRAQHPTCVWPGCRMPARESDLDHHRAWSKDGKTTLTNLGPLCDHHHQTKDKGWTLQRLPDATYQITSPLGRTYTTSGTDPP